MATDGSEFTTELRGYKRSEVDSALAELRGELIQSNKDRARALEELKAISEEMAELRSSLRETEAPSYAGLGGRLEAVLRIAEEQATRIISQADIDADLIHDRARTDATALLDNAKNEAERLLADAQASARATEEAAAEKAQKQVAEAEEAAERVRTEAIEEAASIRGQVATEAAKLRAGAKRETEALRAEVARELAEMRVVADREVGEARKKAADLQRDIEVERATHELTLRKIQEEIALQRTTMEREVAEATAKIKHENETQAQSLAREAEQMRADLEMELGARRHEAEKELLDAHQKAVELNDSFLREAAQQLEDTKARLAAVREDHRRLSEAITDLTTHGKAEAENTARQIVQEAQARAAAIVSEAETVAAERIGNTEKHLIELRAERDTIAEYLASLRTVVGSLEKKLPAKPQTSGAKKS